MKILFGALWALMLLVNAPAMAQRFVMSKPEVASARQEVSGFILTATTSEQLSAPSAKKKAVAKPKDDPTPRAYRGLYPDKRATMRTTATWRALQADGNTCVASQGTGLIPFRQGGRELLYYGPGRDKPIEGFCHTGAILVRQANDPVS